MRLSIRPAVLRSYYDAMFDGPLDATIDVQHHAERCESARHTLTLGPTRPTIQSMQATTRFGELTGIELVPNGPRRAPILFVHGWWGGAWVWDRMMERFSARGHPCFAINLRGYHDSKPVADIGKVTFAEHLEDIRYAVNVLDAPILITHSASGHLALKLSEDIKLPAMVHLVPTPPAGFFSLRTMRVFARYLPRILGGKPVLLNRRDMFDADLNCLPAEERESVYARMVPAPGTQGRQMLMVGVDRKKVFGPRLIISGSEDRLIPPRIHRAMARTYDAKYREYPGRGHYLMREPGWEVIADDIIAWLDESVQADRKAAG